jgi:hypothetical protein
MENLTKKQEEKLATQIEEAAGDPDKINEIVKNHPIVKATQEKELSLSERERKMDFDKIVTELKKDPFYKEVEQEFNEAMLTNPTLPLHLVNVVYDSLVGKRYRAGGFNELITKEKEAAVKATIADMQDKERRAAPKGGDVNDGMEELARPTAVMSEIAKAFGVSANKVAQRIAKSKNKK